MRSTSLAFVVLAALTVSAGAAEPRVTAVRPSGEAVPENLLRISLVFDDATDEAVLSRLRLVDGDGKAVDRPFLDQELWSPDGRILTVLFNPGRVKTGVDLNERFGRPLRAGEKVTLDFDGRAIKSWRVLPPENRRIDAQRWKTKAPAAGASGPLVVFLGRPIDAMEADVPAVVDADGKPVPGRSRLSEGERVWTFTPALPWKAGTYGLLVPPGLEDAEGNTVAAPFEAGPRPSVQADAPVRLEIVVRSAASTSQ